MKWHERYSVGHFIATGAVFIVLVAFAIPANIRSGREVNHKKTLRYMMAFQNAACRYQNSNPALRVFRDSETARSNDFPFKDNGWGFDFTYISDQSGRLYVLLAMPEDGNGDDTAFYADETGTIYITTADEDLKIKYRVTSLENLADFSADIDERLPGAWLPY
ncbi:MAG: hypothetical protein U5N86_09655 [Planctomycetota bacterium]|nr:hypothetical protein [Planctomycetota bacterium]